ncbi:MAG: hypothetical protein WCX79_00300 [Candidatus Paceibacterota bacterium]|jgi:hypothetical protein
MSKTYFTLPEAKTKINHHVKALAPFADINIGDYGIVTSYYKIGGLYGLNVKWEHINITDGFSKSDYERFLEGV